MHKQPAAIASTPALAVLLGALGLLAACNGSNNPALGPMGPAEVGIVVVTPEKVTLDTELPGRAAAYQISEVRPQVGGIILQRLFTEGSDVKAGQALYQIDPALYQASFDSAQAAVAKAEATRETQKAKAARYGELVGIQAISRQDNDDAQAALKQAEADLLSARAALETARINLAYTRVAAPISGRVGKSTVTPGALVTAGQATAMTTVQQLDPIYVDVTQSSADLLRLKRELASGHLKRAGANQAVVKLVLEDGSPYRLTGKLQFSDVTVDPGTGSITLRAIFPNPQATLLPGMYVRAVLETGEDDTAILAPQPAVGRNTKGQAVAWVLNAQDTVEERVLETPRTVGDRWLVTAGLKAGDRLIVEGRQRVQPGVPAKAVPAGSSGAAPAAPAAAASGSPATPPAQG